MSEVSIFQTQEITVRLAVSAKDGSVVNWTGPITWLSQPEIAKVMPDPKDGRMAVVVAVGPGTTQVSASAEVEINGITYTAKALGTLEVVSVKGTGVDGEALAYTATLEWGEARLIPVEDEPPDAPAG